MIEVGGDGIDKIWNGSWNPFMEEQIITTCGNTVTGYDIRDRYDYPYRRGLTPPANLLPSKSKRLILR